MHNILIGALVVGTAMVIFSILAFIVWIFVANHDFQAKCEDRGGVVVRTAPGYACIKAEVLK